MEMVFHLCFKHSVYATVVINGFDGWIIISMPAICNMPAVENVELEVNIDNFVVCVFD